MSGFFDATPATMSTGTSSASATGLPDWYQQYIQGMAGLGVDYANQSDPIYTGARTAGMSTGQAAAQSGAQSLIANGNPLLSQAQSDIGSGLSAISQPTSSWNSTAASQYMSPYTSSVVNEIGRLGNQNFTQNLMPQVQSAFVGAGGSGSTRNAQVLGQVADQNEQNILGQQATALNSGYTGAQAQFNADQARQLQQQTAAGTAGLSAGSTLGSIGANEMGTDLSGLGLLNAVGNQDQTTQQNALNTAYNDFTQQRDWNLTNAGDMHQLIAGLLLPSTTTQDQTKTETQQTPGTSSAQGLSQLLTILGGIAS